MKRNAEAYKAAQRRRYATDEAYREARKAKSLAYYHAHKEERRSYARDYYIANRARLVSQEKARRLKRAKEAANA